MYVNMWLQFLPWMVESHALCGRRFRPAPSAGCVVPSPPLVFEGGVAREEPPLVEQPRRILNGKIGLFGSGQIGP